MPLSASGKEKAVKPPPDQRDVAADPDDGTYYDFGKEKYQSLIRVIFCKMGFGGQQYGQQKKRTKIGQNGKSFFLG